MDKIPSPSDLMRMKIRDVCERDVGLLRADFLCRSVSVLEPRSPIILSENAPVIDAIRLMQRSKRGEIVCVSSTGVVTGIFTERDVLLKVTGTETSLLDEPVKQVMTADPICERMDASIAFILSLMSEGGFRHIPLVDDDHLPLAVVSVKDIVDHLVSAMSASLKAAVP